LQQGQSDESYRQDNGNDSDDRGTGLKIRCEALRPPAMRADGSTFWDRLPTVAACLVLFSYDCPPNLFLGKFYTARGRMSIITMSGIGKAQSESSLRKAASGPAPDGRAEEGNRYVPVRDREPW